MSKPDRFDLGHADHAALMADARARAARATPLTAEEAAPAEAVIRKTLRVQLMAERRVTARKRKRAA